jgi:hypothetical protein
VRDFTGSVALGIILFASHSQIDASEPEQVHPTINGKEVRGVLYSPIPLGDVD